MGFPIRRSLDQSSFAAPQGLSQRTTSFIASQRQGIHQMLLRHLIALMIHVRRISVEHIDDPKARRFKIVGKTASGSRRKLFACLADLITTAAGRRWLAGTRPAKTKSATSLRFQTPASVLDEHPRVS